MKVTVPVLLLAEIAVPETAEVTPTFVIVTVPVVLPSEMPVPAALLVTPMFERTLPTRLRPVLIEVVARDPEALAKTKVPVTFVRMVELLNVVVLLKAMDPLKIVDELKVPVLFTVSPAFSVCKAVHVTLLAAVT